MSPSLKDFYRDLQKWIDSGHKSQKVFSIDGGVCWNLDVWCINNLVMNSSDLHVEMADQFERAGLNKSYPFNAGDAEQWDMEVLFHYKAWENPKRLAWVKEMAE